MFQKKTGRRWSCKSPNGLTKTEIDYTNDDVYICTYIYMYTTIHISYSTCTSTHPPILTHTPYTHVHFQCCIVFLVFPAKCASGTYSVTGVEPCTPCELGTFADKEGTAQCRPCPPGTSTVDEGASQLAHCKGSYFQLDICNKHSLLFKTILLLA